MSRKDRGKAGKPKRSASGLRDQLAAVERQMRRGELAAADRLLDALQERYPQNTDVLTLRSVFSAQVGDVNEQARALAKLVCLKPDDPQLLLGLAGSYAQLNWPALAAQTFRDFLRRWPGHPEAATVQVALAALAPAEREVQVVIGGENAPELALLHERIQVALNNYDLTEAKKLAGEFLGQQQQFAPVWNNLSLVHSMQGDWVAALNCARKVLEFDPNNLHALANLTRFACICGHSEEMESAAARLRTLDMPNTAARLKVAEALASIGHDQGVIDFAGRRWGDDDTLDNQHAAMLDHYVAVAYYRQGEEKLAREKWEAALRHQPAFELALAHLQELKKPNGERHAAWPLPSNMWLPRELIDELLKAAKAPPGPKQQEQVTAGTVQFLKDHPGLSGLVPIFLDRGDQMGREFALLLANQARTPELLQALRDFALGQRGPDALRHRAASICAETGTIPKGEVRMWLEGDWREVFLLGWEITGEPLFHLPPEQEAADGHAMEAMRAGRFTEAEQLFKDNCARFGDSPSRLYNLSQVYRQQRRDEDAEELLEEIWERYPDYSIGQFEKARRAIREQRLPEAETILRAAMQRQRLHYSEMGLLGAAEIEFCLARGQINGARTWLKMLEDIFPGHPNNRLFRDMIRDADQHFRSRRNSEY